MPSTSKPDLLAAIENLYSELPTVHCKGCGTCCVSPTCTVAEFIYLMNGILKTWSNDDIQTIITTPVNAHPEYPGNNVCALLAKNKCGVHPLRTGACRLFGIPALSHMHIKDMVYCRNEVTATGSITDIDAINKWLYRLIELNRTLHPLGTAPWYHVGFNIECWLDLYFDETLTQEYFINLRDTMRSSINLMRFAPHYHQRTGLHDKIISVERFSAGITSGDTAFLKLLLIDIRDSYPLTGTWFIEEAEAFLAEIEESEKKASSPKKP